MANDRGSWLSISPASGGKDEGSVTVSAQANPDTDDRSAVVLLTCGKASARLTVTQMQKDAIVVVYNQATAGHGVNIIITGDGFTAENNTVGGTLETYLIQAARTLLDMDPFSKIKDHLNVYLVYAHSQTEGSESESTKFSAKYEDPREGTTVRGNHDDVMNFLKAAGLDCSSATIAVIMNSPYYAGTDWMYDWLDPYKYYSIGYVPVSWTYELTFIHEIGGHGFGKLSDEYGYVRRRPHSRPLGALLPGQSLCLGEVGRVPWRRNLRHGHMAPHG